MAVHGRKRRCLYMCRRMCWAVQTQSERERCSISALFAILTTCTKTQLIGVRYNDYHSVGYTFAMYRQHQCLNLPHNTDSHNLVTLRDMFLLGPSPPIVMALTDTTRGELAAGVGGISKASQVFSAALISMSLGFSTSQ